MFVIPLGRGAVRGSQIFFYELTNENLGQRGNIPSGVKFKSEVKVKA